MTPTQLLLVKNAQNGDQSAVNELVKEWYEAIFNYAFKYFADREQAQEASQKTFVAVVQRIYQLKDPAKFRSWLYRIATNYCHEGGREHQRAQRLSSLEDAGVAFHPNSDVGPEASFSRQELSEWLTQALAMLPEDQRTLVIMKEYEGLTFREIAETLGISENTAKSRLYYGLTKLRKTLTQWNLHQEQVYYE